ncbi:MAG: hypothetical protein RAO94_10915 [Candidatus Stygibacter australis]|nr:hypothetical protein [Candidatus Stygibacter australis]MDP8322850.1 hypothetical protein [Candidatus Stygibacter australis]
METGFTYIDIVLTVILVGFIVIAIFIDSRNARRNRNSKHEIREEIQNRVTNSSLKKHK